MPFAFSNSVYVGMILTSHQAPTYAQAIFENISIEKSDPNLKPEVPHSLSADFDFSSSSFYQLAK